MDKFKWIIHERVLLPDVPPHINIDEDKEYLKYILKSKGAFFIRWTTDFDSKDRYPFWYVIKDKREDTTLKEYSQNQRSKIRRGLKRCSVDLLSGDSIRENYDDLYQVYKNAFKRYRNVYEPIKTFESFKRELTNYEEIFIVKDRKGNHIIGFSLNRIYNSQEGNVVFYHTLKFDPEFMKLYPAYALIFEMNKYYLNELNFFYVHDGTRSLGHDTTIQDWLIRIFKFRKAYCKLNILYRTDVEMAVRALYPFRGLLYKLENKNVILKKLCILLRHEEIRRKCL